MHFCLLLDGIRDVSKYSTPLEDKEVSMNPQGEATLHMKLFRAQRNFYIAGFTLFLFVWVDGCNANIYHVHIIASFVRARMGSNVVLLSVPTL